MMVISFLMNKTDLIIKEVKWHEAKKYLRKIRTSVFIKEQKVPEELEWDEFDKTCIHILVSELISLKNPPSFSGGAAEAKLGAAVGNSVFTKPVVGRRRPRPAE